MAALCKIKIDASGIEKQVSILKSLQISQNGIDLLSRYACNLGDDVVMSDGVPTTCADGSIEILYSLRLGDGFESLIAAPGALERNNI